MAAVPDSFDGLRSAFLGYFQGRGHKVHPSAPLVPQDDDSLLFVNAGMVPFKPVFTGARQPDALCMVSAQKCVRAGGKHNDLDNVGHTARHHTFFEMLGNFSFGDYFKEQAIWHAWQFLHHELALPADRLWITVHADDDQAAALWTKISGLQPRRIIPISTSDNFWSMGAEGPCGPCSEVFYDHGDQVKGGPPGSAQADGDRFVEIWNLVFMQFERSGGSRTPLPVPCVDTGMGLERIASVMQGVHDNYRTDLFESLIAAGESLYQVTGRDDARVSLQVIADHVRSVSFLIADGVAPGNEGRGYVLRRIMRRAMRHAHMLGAREPLMGELVPTLVELMGGHYPELVSAKASIMSLVTAEETRFQETLGRGLSLLDEAVSGLAAGEVLPGATAFKLYDTYGFPLDLTRDILRNRHIGVDEDAFDAAMDQQRRVARLNWKGDNDRTAAIWLRPPWGSAPTRFVGYEVEHGPGELIGIVTDDGHCDRLNGPAEAELVFSATPFYAHSGGQSADSGTVRFGNGCVFDVRDVSKRPGDVHGHTGRLADGEIRVGQTAHLQIDSRRRAGLRAHHSATHLVHAALRDVLGDHIVQKGSLVEQDRLRFDFSASAPLTSGQITRIEDQVNAVIRDNGETVVDNMTPADAIRSGALALFGEKYGDSVRVLRIGRHRDSPYSVELCGGTHVSRTGDIGVFVLSGQSAVASGVRRIEARVGASALAWLRAGQERVSEIADLLKTAPAELPVRITALIDDNRALNRKLTDARRRLALAPVAGNGVGSSDRGRHIETIGRTRLLAQRLDGMSGAELRALVDDGKKRLGDGVVALVAVNDGKAAMAVGVCGSAQEHFDAVDLVRTGAHHLGGSGGGGRPDMAQAGGPNAHQANEALDAIRQVLAAR